MEQRLTITIADQTVTLTYTIIDEGFGAGGFGEGPFGGHEPARG